MPFSKACEALGVLFDLEQTNLGKCSIRNTPARVDELVHDILERVKEGIISRLQAQKLRGRMQFAESQLFGRTARRCLQVLSAHTTSASSKLSKRDGFFLQQFAILLREGPPRVLAAETEAPLLIFTDAWCERDAKQWVCGLGGVLVDPKNEQRSFFSLELDDEARLALGESCKQQIIFEAETLACLVAFLLWSKKCVNRKCLLFVDNEGTKFCAIKGSSDNACVDMLVTFLAEAEARIFTLSWIARVPSYSNCADPPSRGEVSNLIRGNAVDDSSNAKLIVLEVLARMNKNKGEMA